MKQSEFIKVSEVAAALEITGAAVRNLIKAGVLAAIESQTSLAAKKPSYRIERASFEAFKASRRIASPKAVGQ